jgi:tetratricopeptide (TPR) repeat protein
MSDTPAATKLSIQKGLATMYPRVNRIPEAIAMVKAYTATAGASTADWALLASLYSAQRNCADGLPALEKALAGGKQADEHQLQQQNFCFDKGKQYDKLIAVDEELLKRYPKKEWYQQLLSVYEGDKKVEDMALLNLLRFGFDRDYLNDEGDFVRLANLCLDVGAASEAQRVLEKGISKKLIKQTGATEKNGRLLEQAKTTAASDKKSMEQADAEARAGKNGESDIRVGVRYFAMQQYDKAVEAISRGQAADRAARIKRPDDANMVLGMAFLKLNRKTEANKAFTAAKADPRMTAVARLWATVSGG